MKAENTNTTQPNSPSESFTQLHAAVQGLDDKKADAITVLDLEDKSSVARYYVIATATSNAHLNALRSNLEDVWQDRFGQKLHIDATPGSGWYILDGNDAVIHIFTSELRNFYNLEALWGDAKILPAETFLKNVANS